MISIHDRVWRGVTFYHLILFPLSLVFGLVAAARRILFKSKILASIRLPVPVVVVGNISVGGTGKTPAVRALVAALTRVGCKPGIVSRGYGGASSAPSGVSLESDAKIVGDEPLLLAAIGAPVWVGRDRVAAAQALLAAHPECDLIICDDGLQHYRLARDFEIAVVDGSRLFGNGFLLPAGPLREPVSRLKYVDAVLVNTQEDLPKLATCAPVFRMRLEGRIFHRLDQPGISASADEFAGKRVHAIAGIGNPERFFSQLESLGIRAVNHAFADHHAFTARDIEFPDCDIVLMTEKDAVKCREFAHQNCWVLPVAALIDPGLAHLIVQRKRDPHGSEAA